ncbi:hydrophobin [Coprinopsis cinerea okayama7|uniref:Hydrophobin n=1 Tax=Coprinopsis cinerea (strain Okayama-7 / 130 / ATCC MYA-4618 / FGSC 9003) TaxID=240176 RepID=A8NKG9_COPC7|nr:hydrophobin [Coprinopsis cinerea okayama7\|eukprot:XP_001834446.1 hydrophobin [Coprinopsis cinerea okayama7\
MQFKALISLALAAVSAAVPNGGGGGGSTPPGTPGPGPGQCNTGPIQCCESVQRADSVAASTLLALLGVVVQDLSIPIGITCSPISVIGLPGNSCSSQPVCCEDNSFKGVIAIGCTPVNINV